MTKKKNDKPNIDTLKGLAFEEGMKQLSQEQKEMLKDLNIKSFDDLFEMLAATGADMDMLGDMMDGKVDIPDSEEEFTEKILGSSKPFDEDAFDEGYWDGITKVLHDVKPQEMHIRIKLNGAPVPVWREVKVPSNLSMEAFAELLVCLMGWEGTHLHQFKKQDVVFKSPEDLAYNKDFGFPNRFIQHDANDFHLGNVFQEKGERVKFEYDFGDSWEHDVWLKGIRDYEQEETPQAILVKGSGACPPEDCGGIWGYQDLLSILAKKRKTKEEKERLDWYGIDRYYDPEEYEIEDEKDYISMAWDDLMELHEKLKQ